jgi:IS5 family transposase
MKAHIGIDVKSGLTHGFSTSAANQHGLNEAHCILHGDEEYVFADSGYRDAKKREEFSDHKLDWNIVEQPSKVKNRKSIRVKQKKRSAFNT